MVKSQEEFLKVVFVSAITAILLGGYVIWKQRHKRKRIFQMPIPKKWLRVGDISKINLYPLKSGKNKSLDSASCTKEGLEEEGTPGKLSLKDRSFVVFDECTNERLTIREYPKMLFIQVNALDNSTVLFSCPGSDDLEVKLPSTTNSKKEKNFIIMPYKEKIFTLDCGEEAADWFTKTIVKKGHNRCRLGYYAKDMLPARSAQVPLAGQFKVYKKMDDDYLGIYSDLSSYLVMAQSSLDELNSRLNKPVSEINFRPNIMVKGTKNPFEEDEWDWLKIGEDTVLRSFKGCTRCIVTTTNPETGIRDSYSEPLKTLRKYRTATDPEIKKLEGHSPLMGVNMGLHRTGIIRVGDPVYINVDDKLK